MELQRNLGRRVDGARNWRKLPSNGGPVVRQRRRRQVPGCGGPVRGVLRVTLADLPDRAADRHGFGLPSETKLIPLPNADAPRYRL